MKPINKPGAAALSALALLVVQAVPSFAATSAARCHRGDCVRHGDARLAYGAMHHRGPVHIGPRYADPSHADPSDVWSRPEYVRGQNYTNMYGP
jgi:hypothetical protein